MSDEPVNGMPSPDNREVLVSLLFRHMDLLVGATTMDDVNSAFIPLIVARSLFDFGGKTLTRRAPSKVMRALASEASREWRSFESPHGANGRPPGTPHTAARQFLDGVISQLSHGMTPPQRNRLEAWLLAPGALGEPGSRGTAPDGRLALVGALQADMRARGATDGEIRIKTRALRNAIDNRRRNLRARKK